MRLLVGYCLSGVLLILTGVALFSVPLALIVSGFAVIAAAILLVDLK